MANRFGTSADMIIQPIEENGTKSLLAIDAKGLYITDERYVGNKQADPNRYSSNRNTVNPRLEALGLVPADILAENQHLVQTSGGGDKKKLNPMKASKRKQ